MKKWSPQDEAAYQELLARRAEFEKARNGPLDKVVNALTHGTGADGVYPTALRLRLIQYADDVRDALAPWDSGVRAEEKSNGL